MLKSNRLTPIIGRHFVRDCVPRCEPFKPSDVSLLSVFLSNSNKLLVVTGAGISTESGLPDYRSDEVGAYARNKNFAPVQYQKFVKIPSIRRRYWLRNYLGWRNLFNLKPNLGHSSLVELEKAGLVFHVVTQNVDGLHFKAGSRRVVELHGSAHRVVCLGCSYRISRVDFQNVIASANEEIVEKEFTLNPDGDVGIKEEDCDTFVVPDCPDCGGVLKPDIVFFGDNVPKARVQFVKNLVEESDSLLVCGSSLTVQSSFRIVNNAREQNKPIAIVNIGPTRADNLATLKIQAICGPLLHSAIQLYH